MCCFSGHISVPNTGSGHQENESGFGLATSSGCLGANPQTHTRQSENQAREMENTEKEGWKT